LNTLNLSELTNSFSDQEREFALQTLNTFKNEAIATICMIEKHLNFNIRILEVGAGLCLVSIFLKKQGYDIQALEPCSGGFSFFEELKTKILNNNTDVHLINYSDTAQELSPDTHGTFDLIFSNNVIEHITETKSAFKAMCNVLSDNGKMVHGCPNYIVPYEPHFGIPVFALAPWLTKKIWQTKIEKNLELWNSLNFITYFQIKKIAAQNDCSIRFEKQLTYNAFQRLQNDHEFLSRHQNTIVGKVYKLMQTTNTLALTKYIPTCLSTPMIFILKNNNTI